MTKLDEQYNLNFQLVLKICLTKTRKKLTDNNEVI